MTLERREYFVWILSWILEAMIMVFGLAWIRSMGFWSSSIRSSQRRMWIRFEKSSSFCGYCNLKKQELRTKILGGMWGTSIWVIEHSREGEVNTDSGSWKPLPLSPWDVQDQPSVAAWAFRHEIQQLDHGKRLCSSFSILSLFRRSIFLL